MRSTPPGFSAGASSAVCVLAPVTTCRAAGGAASFPPRSASAVAASPIPATAATRSQLPGRRTTGATPVRQGSRRDSRSILMRVEILICRQAALPVFQARFRRVAALSVQAGRPARWSSGSWDRSRCGTKASRFPSVAKPRALLAALVLHPNEVVSTDRLIDDLGARTRPNAALRVNVSRLRKALAPRRTDDLVARPRSTTRAGLARPPPLRAPGGRGSEPARTRPGRRRGGAPGRGAIALERPAARGLHLRELRADSNRPARGDQAGGSGAPNRDRPCPRAPRRGGRRARGVAR